MRQFELVRFDQSNNTPPCMSINNNRTHRSKIGLDSAQHQPILSCVHFLLGDTAFGEVVVLTFDGEPAEAVL